MKQATIVAAIALLAAGAASAQSSVTIYGRVNTTVESQKNIGAVGTQRVMQDNASRLGFKGVEDLGGGLKAEFFLEHRFASDTGQAAQRFWAGDSYVGLSGGFGSIKLGRLTSAAYYATADYISFHNHDTGTSADVLYTYLTDGSNTISYTTPSLGGLTAEFTVSAAESPTNGLGKVANVALNYNVGALQFGFGYEKRAGGDNQWTLRGNYEMGALLLGAYYQKSDLNGLGKRDAYRLSAMYTVGASEFHVNYGAADDWSRLNNSDASQYTFGYNYNLSKRTKVYGFYTAVDNSRNLAYFGATDRFGNALKASSLGLGVRHNF
jgi:predicted porin